MATKTADTEVTETATEVTETEPVNRIPEALSSNPLFLDFLGRFLEVIDKISEYNTSVLGKKDNEWDRHKVLAKAKELGRPMDANVKPVDSILEKLKAYENVMEELAIVRDELISETAAHLGISLNAVAAERDKDKEAPLLEDRKKAVSLRSTLLVMADTMSDNEMSTALVEFLQNNPIPAVGRNQTSAISTDSGTGATPKYRVKVKVEKDGKVLLDADGFTKAVQSLTQPVFGYERGQAPKADKLRAAWEAAGNGPGKTVKTVVEFEDNGLKYTLTAK